MRRRQLPPVPKETERLHLSVPRCLFLFWSSSARAKDITPLLICAPLHSPKFPRRKPTRSFPSQLRFSTTTHWGLNGKSLRSIWFRLFPLQRSPNKKMWWMMSETGGNYCSKKSDDLCSKVCGQVCTYLRYIYIYYATFQFLVYVVQLKVGLFCCGSDSPL